MTEPAWRATAAILEALNARYIERVIVLAHSQGTIIVANVLRAVAKALHSDSVEQQDPRWEGFTERLMGGVDTETQKMLRNSLAQFLAEFTEHGLSGAFERLRKLEVYTFANCADRMRYVFPVMQVPYMEHFANECDVVARLGVLSPLRSRGDASVEIDGPVFEQKGAWGHLLNEHYLTAIDDHLGSGDSKHSRDYNPYLPQTEHLGRSRLYEYFRGKRPEDLPSQSVHVD